MTNPADREALIELARDTYGRPTEVAERGTVPDLGGELLRDGVDIMVDGGMKVW